MSIGSILAQRLKKTLLVWIAVYPAVLLVLTLVGDLFRDWPLALRVLASTALIVPIVANITEPAVKAGSDAIERAWARRQSRRQ